MKAYLYILCLHESSSETLKLEVNSFKISVYMTNVLMSKARGYADSHKIRTSNRQKKFSSNKWTSGLMPSDHSS